MKKSFSPLLTVLIFLTLLSCKKNQPLNLDQYNVIWTEQSINSSESMPAGGHDIGMNVWVEDGDILFYAQRTGSFTENNEYFKLGRFRVKLSPNPFTTDAKFKQELKLQQGYIEITGSNEQSDANISIWVDVKRPVIHVDIDCSAPVEVEAFYEGWRNKNYELQRENFHTAACYTYENYDGIVTSYKDVVSFENDAVCFYHRNKDDKLLIDKMIKNRGLEKYRDQIVNTQKGRTFGGWFCGKGFVANGIGEGKYIDTEYKSWKLKSKKAHKKHSLKVYAHVAQTKTLEEWKSGLNKMVNSTSPSDEIARKESLEWWNEFWQRSWFIINPENPDPNSKAWQLGRNYQLFRYQLGCNAFGEYPTKFNGANFTYDPSLIKSHGLPGIDRSFPLYHNPDFRLWGGGSFTGQNQRLLYWGLLRTGDFDIMPQQFEFYNRALGGATVRVKDAWGIEGCLFPEQLENFGFPADINWKQGKDYHDGYSQLEYSYMIMEYYRYTGNDISAYMDFIKKSLAYFDNYYQKIHKEATGNALDENGKLVLYPSVACESYRGATNSTVFIAGLNACLKSMLKLPSKYVSDKEKVFYRNYLERIPGYGYDEIEGDKIIKAAWSWEWKQLDECPQFYPLFPFNQFELGVDDMTVFKNTWKHGDFFKYVVQSWHQDGIFFARMGMTKDAKKYNTQKMEDSPRKFPTFWGPGCDWVPDHNWGGSGMIGLQEMLMQTSGNEIRLFPAWPKEWDVDFKLFAPQNTIVEGKLIDGKLEFLRVTPKSREEDVINMIR